MKPVAGFRGSGKVNLATWRINARKAATLQKKQSYGMGGLPRRYAGKEIAMPVFKFKDDPK